MTAGSLYSDEQRREAVTQYVLLGNWRRVSQATGIPQRTLNDWATRPWFATLIAEVRAEKATELDGALTRIIHEATDQLLDRLRHGDHVLVGGKLERKPLAARDLAIVAGIVYDKRALSRNQPTVIDSGPDLAGLAEFLADRGREKIAQMRGVGETSVDQ